MQWLTKLDFKILHSIQDLSCSTLDFLMPKITTLGNGGILWVLIAIFLLFNSRTRKNGIQLGIGCIIGIASVKGTDWILQKITKKRKEA